MTEKKANKIQPEGATKQAPEKLENQNMADIEGGGWFVDPVEADGGD